MSTHRVSLPRADWPADIRERFETSIAGQSRHQQHRLTGALGRWLKAARDEGMPPDQVTADLWRARTAGLGQSGRDAVRQVLAAVFPATRAALFSPGAGKKPARGTREKLAALIERNLARWPADWRDAAAPLLIIGADALEDGILVQAWSQDTIKGRVEYCSAHFEFCRTMKLPVDITPKTVRANLRHRQARCAAGELRIGGTSVYLSQFGGLACALFPGRDWGWLLTARDRMKKLAKAHPSRNDGRVIDIVELRIEALKETQKADRAQEQARTHRQRIAAHTRARTALGMLLLSEAPIRIESLAGVEIGRQLSPDLRTISLAAHETKEGDSDQRCLSNDAVAAIVGYIRRHRATVAPKAEATLFVADDGAALSGDHLSRTIGNHCQKTFGRRTTGHPIRNSVGSFIVGEAPEEAGLAPLVLHHKRPATTNVYTGTAHQVIAGEKLRGATTATAAAVGARPSRPQRRSKPTRPRSLRAELAERAARRAAKGGG